MVPTNVYNYIFGSSIEAELTASTSNFSQVVWFNTAKSVNELIKLHLNRPGSEKHVKDSQDSLMDTDKQEGEAHRTCAHLHM